MQWRIADLITHCWDLTQATGVPADVPADLAEQALAFVQVRLPAQQRGGRFADPRPIADGAPVLDRLAAFTDRIRPWRPAS